MNSRFKTQYSKSKVVGLYLLLVMTILYCAGPLLWQFITSLKPDTEVIRMPPLLPQDATLDHYVSIFEGHPFLRIILNSAVVASLTTLLSLIIGSLAAFGLAKLDIKYKALILGFVLSISMFPPIATVSPLYIIIRSLGLRDTRSEEHTSELQSQSNLVCRLLLEKKK